MWLKGPVKTGRRWLARDVGSNPTAPVWVRVSNAEEHPLGRAIRWLGSQVRFGGMALDAGTLTGGWQRPNASLTLLNIVVTETVRAIWRSRLALL